MSEPDERILTTEQLLAVLRLLRGADSAELKLSLPEGDRRSAVEALGMDPLDAQIRQVVFFDTPDLRLQRQGLVVRARRVQAKGGDSIVKLRPVDAGRLPAGLRRSKAFSVEVDALPGGFVCSASMTSGLSDLDVSSVVDRRRGVRKLFTKEQREFFRLYAPDDLELDDLDVLGPIFVLELRFSPADYDRRLAAELWLYPDGSRILELSTKCPPALAFDVAAQTRAFLSSRGIELTGEQQTKTRRALELFSSRHAGAAVAG
jgi:hypothetical protein